METLRFLILILNGLTLSLTLAFLLIILWFNRKKTQLQSFAIFLFLVAFWHSTTLLSEIMLLIDVDRAVVMLLSALGDIGFAGASIALYVFVSSLIVAHTRLLSTLAWASLLIVIANNFFIIRTLFNTEIIMDSTSFSGISIFYFLLFDVVTIYLILTYRRKIRSDSLIIGLVVFVIAQGLAFLNPELGISSFALLLSGIGLVIVSFSIIQLELIEPLGEKVSQVETIQQISLSIMQRRTLELVVDEATRAVVNWLNASAAAVCLIYDDEFRLASSYDMPTNMLILSNNQGLLRKTWQDSRSYLVDNYYRDWRERSDFAYGTETVGSVMSVPLFSQSEVLGVLLVLSGRRNQLFEAHDLQLLEQLSNQVAIAISHSQLFTNLAQAHNQLEIVLESTYNPVIAISTKRKIIFCNPSARKIIKENVINADTIINGNEKIPRQFLPKDFSEFVTKIREDGYFNYEYDLGHSIYVCRIAPLQSNQIDGWVAVLNDITNLRELDRMKSEMVRMTSHDLKNPIQAAIANLDLLREDIDLDNEEAMLSVSLIEKQLDKMSRIISGILDLERIDMGRNRYTEPNSIFAILSQALDEVEDYANEKNIILIGDFDVLREENIKCDFNQLKRAFVNLLENAIKFTPSSGTVWLTGTLYQSHQMKISVCDTGVGISKELQKRIFDRFFRGQQEMYEHVSGSGLGLSFVKSIIEYHKGSISVESAPNEGSCFIVILERLFDFA